MVVMLVVALQACDATQPTTMSTGLPASQPRAALVPPPSPDDASDDEFQLEVFGSSGEVRAKFRKSELTAEAARAKSEGTTTVTRGNTRRRLSQLRAYSSQPRESQAQLVASLAAWQSSSYRDFHAAVQRLGVVREDRIIGVALSGKLHRVREYKVRNVTYLRITEAVGTGSLSPAANALGVTDERHAGLFMHVAKREDDPEEVPDVGDGGGDQSGSEYLTAAEREDVIVAATAMIASTEALLADAEAAADDFDQWWSTNGGASTANFDMNTLPHVAATFAAREAAQRASFGVLCMLASSTAEAAPCSMQRNAVLGSALVAVGSGMALAAAALAPEPVSKLAVGGLFTMLVGSAVLFVASVQAMDECHASHRNGSHVLDNGVNPAIVRRGQRVAHRQSLTSYRRLG